MKLESLMRQRALSKKTAYGLIGSVRSYLITRGAIVHLRISRLTS
jgi:hypothetical protein